MSRQPKAPKPVKMWAVVDPSGDILIWSARYRRNNAIRAAIDNGKSGVWRFLYRRGYRCVRVTVIPEGYDANGWRPIESAPKGGNDVELWVIRPSGVKARRVGYQIDGKWWIYFNGQETSVSNHGLTPTHWRPLDGPENTK